jgi:hypothetical protein
MVGNAAEYRANRLASPADAIDQGKPMKIAQDCYGWRINAFLTFRASASVLFSASYIKEGLGVKA